MAFITLRLKREEIVKNKVLLSGLIVAVGFIWFGYNEIYKSTSMKIFEVKKQIKDKTINIKDANRLQLLQKELDTFNVYFAKDKDVSWLMARVSNLAKEAGLEILSLSSQPMISLKGFNYGSLNISLRGTFHQLGDFVSSIESSHEFMRIERFFFKKDKEFLNADITVSAYFLKS